MIIPNYDVGDDVASNFKQLYDFMPNQCFRMLVCGPSGSGKTNTLMHMIYNLLYFDKVYLYAKNLDQSKYQNLMDILQPITMKLVMMLLKQVMIKLFPLKTLIVTRRKLSFSTILYVIKTKNH